MSTVKLSVSGLKSEFHRDILQGRQHQKLPQLVSDAAKQGAPLEFSFDRPSGMFAYILAYYQSGELHMPTCVCPGMFEKELNFWGIDAEELSQCCYFRYTRFLNDYETQRKFKQETTLTGSSTVPLVPVMPKGGVAGFRDKVWRVVDNSTDTLAAKIYFGVVVSMIVLSIIGLALSTEPSMRRDVNKCELIEYLEYTDFHEIKFIKDALGHPTCTGDIRIWSSEKIKIDGFDWQRLWDEYVDSLNDDEKSDEIGDDDNDKSVDDESDLAEDTSNDNTEDDITEHIEKSGNGISVQTEDGSNDNVEGNISDHKEDSSNDTVDDISDHTGDRSNVNTVDDIRDHTGDDMSDHIGDGITDHTADDISDHTEDRNNDNTVDDISDRTEDSSNDNMEDSSNDHTVDNISNHTKDSSNDNTVDDMSNHTEDSSNGNTEGSISDHTEDSSNDNTVDDISDHTEDRNNNNTVHDISDHTEDSSNDTSEGSISDHTEGSSNDDTEGDISDHSVDDKSEHSGDDINDHIKDGTIDHSVDDSVTGKPQNDSSSTAKYRVDNVTKIERSYLSRGEIANLTDLRNGSINRTRPVIPIPRLTVPVYTLDVLENIAMALFTVDFLIRLFSCPSLKMYFLSFLNVIDACALVSSYIYAIVLIVQRQYRYEKTWIHTLEYLQIFRVFRLFRVVQNVRTTKVLVYSVRKNLRDVLVISLLLLLAVAIFSTVFFFTEEKITVDSIPEAWYWAIVTLTTVGYGDLSPKTYPGRLVASLCAVCGIMILAVTLQIFVNNFLVYYDISCVEEANEVRRSKYCTTSGFARDGSMNGSSKTAVTEQETKVVVLTCTPD